MRQAWLLAAALLLAPFVVRAQAAAEPKLTQHVTDRTGTLSAEQIAALEAPLVQLEQKKGAQLAILVIPSTGSQSIEEYSLAVAEANKLGREKPDDGLLLLVAKEDRKARIEVGYGLEGAVTDAMSSRIIREYLAPKFRNNDYYGGLSDAEGALVKLVEGEQLPAPMTGAPGGSGPDDSGFIIFAIVIGFAIGSFAGGLGFRPALLRRGGAAFVAGLAAWFITSVGLGALIAAVVAFVLANAGGGRFGSGRGGWGSFPGGGGWGGSGGGGGGGWSGGGGSFGGGGASGGW